MSSITVDLKDKVTLIPGGGSALQTAKCGAAVVVTDIDGESAARVADEISSQGGENFYQAALAGLKGIVEKTGIVPFTKIKREGGNNRHKKTN